MKKAYSTELIVKLLREVDAGQVANETVEGICRELGVVSSDSTSPGRQEDML